MRAKGGGKRETQRCNVRGFRVYRWKVRGTGGEREGEGQEGGRARERREGGFRVYGWKVRGRAGEREEEGQKGGRARERREGGRKVRRERECGAQIPQQLQAHLDLPTHTHARVRSLSLTFSETRTLA